jgi:hypothetical protein
MAAGQTTTDTFVVSVAFTSSCTINAGNAAADLAFTHTAFDAVETKTTSTTFSCTRGLTPTFSFDTGTNQTSSAAAAVGTAITGEGLVAGLRYTLAGATSKTAGTAATAGAAGVGGSNGTADSYVVAITASIPAGQAGDASLSATQTRVLTITY